MKRTTKKRAPTRKRISESAERVFALLEQNATLLRAKDSEAFALFVRLVRAVELLALVQSREILAGCDETEGSAEQIADARFWNKHRDRLRGDRIAWLVRDVAFADKGER